MSYNPTGIINNMYYQDMMKSKRPREVPSSYSTSALGVSDRSLPSKADRPYTFKKITPPSLLSPIKKEGKGKGVDIDQTREDEAPDF